ncbi:MAG TPA: bifunctional transaldolase/phosoglucose isomerase [Candidatus Binatia bacterium]|jgi:transaldolase / glucose-6-phosphate isomerase|nr:bifunctional transaldolase/phosoglucose isomerase [Candidatus Binatia bacterium]
MNRMKELLRYGQSVWLDYIHRNLFKTGELKKLIDEDGLRGMTSNPTIFEKAIAHGDTYDETIKAALADDPKTETGKIYERLVFEDIRAAADVLRPVYDETGGGDGFVSIEVSPLLANDTEGTIAEARRLKKEVNRPNVMIKVPATPAGIPAIEELTAEGVNVNITLMFSMGHYEAVAGAYARGLERAENPRTIASVASFFVSRVDTLVDKDLEKIGTPAALALRGKIAIANSKAVYRRFEEIFHGEGFAQLRSRGGRVQRPLWASTGTKNPEYSDVLYVENLIGAETVNTLPPATIDAFRDHGEARGATVKENLDDAFAILDRAAKLGIDLEGVGKKLQDDGVAAFVKSFDDLMAALEKKRAALSSSAGAGAGGGALDRQEFRLGKYQSRVDRRLKSWQAENFAERLWRKDTTLWSAEPLPELADRLGWLDLPETMTNQVKDIRAFAEKVKADGFRHVVVLGMGGSSLAPEVFQRAFGNAAGYPQLLVLDSTHPAAVRAVEGRIAVAQTLFLVSSKSGTTIEPNSFFYYFWKKVGEAKAAPGENFAAITDPGTALEKLAHERKFRAVFQATPDVGGRYSALTVFGLVPAALVGVDIGAVLERARLMARASAGGADNPALALGAALGELALAKRDKVTFIASASVAAFPAWIEQLIAESTGKDNKGITPVATEPVAAPEKYGADRFFVYLKMNGDDKELDAKVKALELAGHPIARIEIADKIDLGQEFFRWEVAVAAAGAAIGIHPFNQPDVQLAKDLAKEAMAKKDGGKGAKLKDEISVASAPALREAVSSWLGKKKERDYLSVQAYLNPSERHTEALTALSAALRDRLRLAATFGYGPRFLHSTGQLHKGGPNSVLALQIIDEPAEDLPVPETDYTFGALIRAQALGDFTALKQRKRRVLRINLGADSESGLKRLLEMVRA